MVTRTPTLLLFLLLPLPPPLHAQDGTQCRSRSFGSDSVVCVCDSQHCDLPGRLTLPDPGHYTVVTSSRDGLRFKSHTQELHHQAAEGAVEVVVEDGTPRQTMLGFGASFTDASGINVAALSPTTQDLLLRSYFSPEGVEYSLCRVPIGGSDFSVRPYTYDDVEDDVLLEHFTLAEEDKLYKVPQLRRAQELAERPVRVVASPWSPPPWMKTNRMINGSGELLPEMRQPWANYIVKFVKEYEAAGVALWGLTTQNHPQPTVDVRWNSCLWRTENMRDWIRDNLGPTLDAAGLADLKVIVGDENRDVFPQLAKEVLADPEAARYTDGVSVHWYADEDFGPEHLDQTHQLFPDKFIFYSEACIVPGLRVWNDPGYEPVVLGSWSRAESYAVNIIEGVNHYSAGWVDWNMALDMTGGPNWAGNQVDAAIIVNSAADEFYKQPMFYVMGHFSKFVAPGARQLPSWVAAPHLLTAAFLHPDGLVVVVLLNTGEEAREVSLEVGHERYAHLHLPAKAIQTVVVSGEDKSAGSHAKTKYTSEGQH